MKKNLFQEMYDNPINYRFFKGKPFISKEETKNSLIKNYIGCINKLQVSDEKNFFDKILDYFNGKQSDSLKEEKALAKKLIKKGDYPADQKDQIKFWTTYFSGIDSNKFSSEQIADDLWLKIIFSSSEFASNLATRKEYSTFYRSGLLKKEDEGDKGKVEQRLLDAFEESFEKGLEESGIENDLYESIDKIISNTGLRIQAKNTKILIDDINIKDFDSLKTAIKKWGELVVEDVLRRLKRSENARKNVSKINYKYIRQQLQHIKLKSSSNEVYLAINIGEEKGVYGKAKANNASVATAFYDAALNIIENKIFPNKQFSILHIGGGRVVKLPYKEKSFNILSEDKKIRGSVVEKNLKGEYQSNIYGFLGEYLRLYEIKNINLTGIVQDTYTDDSGKEVTLGESFSDANFTLENNENSKKYGLNIKHYVSKFESNSITIYDAEEGLSFFSKFMRRYFSDDECKILRFLDVNYNFFKQILKAEISENEVLQAYTQIAYKNLSRFVRIDSAVTDFSNFFYVINNIYIPTSYIYFIICEILKKEQNTFFSFVFSPAKTPSGNQKEESSLISNFVSTSINATKIFFKGLKIDGLKELLT